MDDFKRPSKDESDEDILKLQEEFYKKKERKSVDISNIESQKDVFSPSEGISANTDCQLFLDDGLTLESKFNMCDIQEQEVSIVEPFVFEPEVLPSANQCFSLRKTSERSQFSKNKSKQSIFCQLIEQKGSNNEKVKIDQKEANYLINDNELSEQKQEVNDIHNENLQKLSSMSEEEILLYKKQLEEHLDPKILSFIKTKTKLQPSSNASKMKQNSSLSQKAVFFKQEKEEIIKKEGREDCDALILNNMLIEDNFHDNVDKKNNTESLKKDFEIPEETKKILESSQGRWKNMNNIEKEKLEWMSKLPKPNPVDLKTGCPARFDFEGRLLAYDLVTPTSQGLHHHGADPQLAGYSLEELFLLARSTIQSQRITALNTIAHILDNYWSGRLDSCFENPLLPAILEAGLVPLLRWALDDTSLPSLAATLTVINSLLISKPDQMCLQRTFTWLTGHIIPQTEPQNLMEPNVNMEELTDADLIKLDVIKGFLRMDILPRFVYILQIMHPPPLVCKLIIEICTQFVLHSTNSAIQVAEHFGLLNVVFEKFLPVSWKFVDGSKLSNSLNYSCPMPAALKLIRILCSSHKKLCLYMIDMDIISVIMVYLTIQPIDSKVPLQDFQSLVIETLKTLYVLLSYGYGFQVFLDLFPIFLKQMDFCLNLDLSLERTKHYLDFDYAMHFFKVLEVVARVSFQTKSDNNSLLNVVTILFKKALVCLKKWLWQFSQGDVLDYGMNLLASCLNFVSTFTLSSHKELVCEDWEPCSSVKEVLQKYMFPCLKSPSFLNMFSTIMDFSLLLKSSTSDKNRDSTTLVSLGSILWEGDVVPLLKEQSPIPLILAVVNFLVVHKSLVWDNDNLVLKTFFKNEHVIAYLKKIAFHKKLNWESWFSSFESLFIFKLLELSAVAGDFSVHVYNAALSLLLTIKPPYEYLIDHMLETFVFNSMFLNLFRQNHKELSEKYQELPNIRISYLCFFKSNYFSLSRNLIDGISEIESLSSLSELKPVLCKDWQFLPIFQIYQASLKKNDALSLESAGQITNTLKWIHLCYELNLSILQYVPYSVQFCYLCMIFLLDSSLFLDPKVKILLYDCLSIIMQKKLDISKMNWTGIGSFEDIYLELLVQFEAVSYGDETFSNIILFPLQQHFPLHWKKLLFVEHPQVLHFLRIPLNKIIVPLKGFLENTETDIEILSEYFKLLISGVVDFYKCPLPFLMSVHHLNTFLFLKDSDHTKNQRCILSSVLNSKHAHVRRQILLYSHLDIDGDQNLIYKNELQSSELEHLNKIIGRPVNLRRLCK